MSARRGPTKLERKRSEILDFTVDLPVMLPRCVAPRLRLKGDWDESDLVYEALFRREVWRLAPETRNFPQPYPPEYFHPKDRIHIRSEFLTFVQWRLSGSLPSECRTSFNSLMELVVGQELDSLFRYRLLLAIQWLSHRARATSGDEETIQSLKKLISRSKQVRGRQKSDPDRLLRIAVCVRSLRRLLELPPLPERPELPDPVPKSASELEKQRARDEYRALLKSPWVTGQESDLPDIMKAWPERIRDLASAVQAVRGSDIDADYQRAVEDVTFRRLPSQYTRSLRDRYDPGSSKRRDLNAVEFVSAVDRCLPPVFSRKFVFIAEILDAIYPKSNAKWNARTIARYPKLIPS